MKHVKQKSISELKDGDLVDDTFVVKIKKAVAQYARGYSFDLILSDNSGKTLDYKYWGPNDEKRVKTLFDSIKQDDVVRVQGKIGTYNNKLQLTTNEPMIIHALKEGEYEKSDFIKVSKKDISEMYNQILEIISSIKNNQLKELVNSIFSSPEIISKFMKHPAAIEVHHNWVSGLMQHTLEMIKICETSCELYPELNRDLLIAGCMLHDIGKLEELELTSRIKATQKGQLIGHIGLGIIDISKKMDTLNFDELTKNKILHLMVSHHGKFEYGALKEPMFPEAVVLYYADELSSKTQEMLEIIKTSETEDDFMFSKRHNRNIFLK